MPDIINHPVKHDAVDRVFVGIPDVFTAEQLARLQGLICAEKIGLRFSLKDGEDQVGETIAAAARFAGWILTGVSE